MPPTGMSSGGKPFPQFAFVEGKTRPVDSVSDILFCIGRIGFVAAQRSSLGLLANRKAL